MREWHEDRDSYSRGTGLSIYRKPSPAATQQSPARQPWDHRVPPVEPCKGGTGCFTLAGVTRFSGGLRLISVPFAIRCRLLPVFTLLLALAGSIHGAEKEYPITPQEKEAYQLLQDGRFVKARETAQAILAGNTTSFVALYVMSYVYGSVEGSLPRAHYYLECAKDLLEKRWGQRMAAGGPWRWHIRVLS